MTNEYDIVWRWKRKEYKYFNRLLAKIMDLLIIYLIAFIIDLGLRNFQLDLDIKMKYRLYLFLYFVYELTMYVLLKATIGKWFFKLTYKSRDNENNLNQFVIRLISYLVIAALSIEFRIYLPFILYYLIKSLDKYSGPFWDGRIKVLGIGRPSVIRYLITVIIVSVMALVSLSNESLLKDYVKDYSENSKIALFSKGFINNLKGEGFNDDIYASYIRGGYQGIVKQFENEEFTNLGSDESYNFLGLSYMELEEASKALGAFHYALDILDEEDHDLESSIYNNMCWANNDLGEYELAINYAKKAIVLDDQSTYVYTNYGNALFNLERYEEAIVQYEKAIAAKDYQGNFVYTSIGECFYQLEDYKNAAVYFDKYLELDPSDPQSYYDLAWAKALEADDYIAGLEEINEMVVVDNNSNEALLAKSEYLLEFYANEQNIKFLTEDINKEVVLEDPDLSYMLLSSYFQEAMYDDTIRLGQTMIKSGSMDLGVWYTLLDAYYYTDDFTSLLNVIKNFQVNSEDSVDTLFEVAYMYSYNYYYKESGKIYEELVTNREDYELSDERFDDALYEWLITLYDSDQFDQFIEVANKYKDISLYTNLYHFLGLGYYEIGEYELALDHYIKSIEDDPEGNYMYEDIIYLHLYNGDYDLAREYLEEAKAKGLDQDLYSEIDDYILDFTNGHPAELIFDFIEENYMYYKDSPQLRDLKNQLLSKTVITDQEFLDINKYAFGNDYFSFVFHGDEFKYYMDMEEEATVSSEWVSDEHLYVKIDFFSSLTDTEFLRAIETVESSKDKSLIVDVRGNFGGDLDSAMNILDYLIGNKFLGEWDSPLDEPYYYYSDGDVIEFKHIYILTDDESASSSEVITLGMREYIDHVTVIGETTYGKGVGQVSMNNLKYEYALFVVNAYWNINGLNIHEQGIGPDIELIDGTLEDYLTIILTN